MRSKTLFYILFVYSLSFLVLLGLKFCFISVLLFPVMNSPIVCDESVLVIVGGMGPMAGIECYKYVLENTTTNGTDQDNLNSLIISYPRSIGNRVDYVLGKSCKNPGESVLDFLQSQLECIVRTYKRVVIGVACITFHCPSVFSVFQQGVKSRFPEVELVSIISATVEFVRTLYPHLRRVGIMSTDGTRHVRPFEDDMSKQGISLVYLNDDQQSIITSCIFNEQW